MAQCTAKSKRSGERCRRSAMIGREVCMMHGGKTPVGVFHPATKHGRHSKYLPARLLDKYQESQHDADLLALHQEIGVIDALLAEALQRLDATDSSQLWIKALKAYRTIETARRAGDAPGMRTALLQLGDILERGAGDRANRDEVVKLIASRKQLVESERKRRVEMQQMISAEEAMTLVKAITTAVKLHVDDPVALAAISTECARLLGRPVPDEHGPLPEQGVSGD